MRSVLAVESGLKLTRPMRSHATSAYGDLCVSDILAAERGRRSRSR